MVGYRSFSSCCFFCIISFSLYFIIILDLALKINIISCRSSAAPVLFTKELESQVVDEGDSVSLHCELSKSAVPLEWKKGELGLCPCAKYDIKQVETLATLIIHDVDPEDSGSYTCDAGDCRSTAQLFVKGTLVYSDGFHWIREIFL